MRLKLFSILFILFLVLSPACAQEVSIQEIGTEPEALIDGTHAGFYANLTNNGTVSTLIDIDFKLDNILVEKKSNVNLGAGTSFRIISDNSSIVSPDNKNITAIVYFNGKNVSKSKAININKRENPPVQEKSGSIFGYLLIAGGILIIVIYLFVRIRRNQEEKERIQNEILSQMTSEKAVLQPQDSGDSLMNDFAHFLNDLKNPREECSQKEEYRLMSAILENTNNMAKNFNMKNIESAKSFFENIKRDTKTLISRFKETQIDAPVKVIQEPVKTQDITELREELQKQRNELGSKKQFVDVLIPEYLLNSAEEKIKQKDIKAARGLISAARNMLENEMVIHRLRKLKEIGF